jgi:hypothetical protein
MDFRTSRHDEWDGVSERRRTVVPAGNPDDPVTREYLEDALMRNRHSTKEYINTKVTELEELIRAGFPYGDPIAHCKVHETYIQRAEDRAKFWKGVWEKVATGAIYAAIVAVGTAVWQYIKSEAHK